MVVAAEPEELLYGEGVLVGDPEGSAGVAPSGRALLILTAAVARARVRLLVAQHGRRGGGRRGHGRHRRRAVEVLHVHHGHSGPN